MRRSQGVMVLLFVLVVCHCEAPQDNDAPPATIRLQVAVSESALPLVHALARDAATGEPAIELDILPPSHSGGALAAVSTADADLAILTREPQFEELQGDLRYMQLARDGLVFATYPGTRIHNLTTRDIQAIYSGEVTNWAQLGGRDQKIVVLDRPEHSSPKIVLRRSVLGEEVEITPAASILERPGMMDVSLATIPGAIGYTSLGAVISEDMRINVLSLDGVQPTVPNVREGIYPLYRQVGMVISDQPTRQTMQFVESVYSNESFQLMGSIGYPSVMMDLTIGVIPEINPVRQAERYQPLGSYLSGNMGCRIAVRLVQVPSYAELLDEFLGGRLDAAFFGSYTYAVAQAHEDVALVARPEKDGVSTYKGLIFVRKDSGIRTVTDMRRKRFSMISDTTAADLFPRVWLKRQGIEAPERFLGKIIDAGSHETSVNMVLGGEADVGAAKDLVFQRLASVNPRILSELVILAESDPVPDNALAIRSATYLVCANCHQDDDGGGPGGTSLQERLAVSLQNLDSEVGGPAILQAIGADRFIATSDAEYANLYLMAEELGIDLAEVR